MRNIYNPESYKNSSMNFDHYKYYNIDRIEYRKK